MLVQLQSRRLSSLGVPDATPSASSATVLLCSSYAAIIVSRSINSVWSSATFSSSASVLSRAVSMTTNRFSAEDGALEGCGSWKIGGFQVHEVSERVRFRLGDRCGRGSGPGQSEGHATSNERDQDERDDRDPKHGQHHVRTIRNASTSSASAVRARPVRRPSRGRARGHSAR